MGYSNITQLCFDRRLYIKELSKVEKTKHELFIQQAVCSEETLPPMGELLVHELVMDPSVKYLISGILDHLNPDDVRALVMSEDELATSQRFTRIFPNVTSHKYFK